MSQVAYKDLISGNFCSMKQLGVFLLLPEWDASPSQGYTQHLIHWYPFVHLGGERHCESEVSCPRTQPGLLECTNHEATRSEC